MSKKLISALLALLLSLAPAIGWAELQLDKAYQYMPSIKPIPGTGYLTMESKTDNSLGLFTTAGEEVIPYSCSAITYMNHGYFSVTKDKNAENSLAIFRGGQQISDYQYGYITVLDKHWIAGYVLEKTDGAADISLNKINYLILQWDLYYVDDSAPEEGFLVASLDSQQFTQAQQHGDCIAIKDRDGAVRVYDRSFQPVNVEVSDVKSSFYRVETYQIISNISNEVIANGYTEVAEANLPGRMLLTANTVNMAGEKVSAILDLDGTELMPAEYTIVTMGDPYVVVANGNGQRGLYSLDEKKLIVPCEFSNIVTCATSVNPYVNNGFVCVEKDGKRGFVNAETGEISAPLTVNSRIAKVYGSSIVFDGEDGFVLVAGDGTRTELFDCSEIAASNGNGTLLVAKKNGYYGIIDWHGNEMLPFIHKNVITLTDDSRALIRTSTGYELDVITSY